MLISIVGVSVVVDIDKLVEGIVVDATQQFVHQLVAVLTRVRSLLVAIHVMVVIEVRVALLISSILVAVVVVVEAQLQGSIGELVLVACDRWLHVVLGPPWTPGLRVLLVRRLPVARAGGAQVAHTAHRTGRRDADSCCGQLILVVACWIRHQATSWRWVSVLLCCS